MLLPAVIKGQGKYIRRNLRWAMRFWSFLLSFTAGFGDGVFSVTEAVSVVIFVDLLFFGVVRVDKVGLRASSSGVEGDV